MKKKLLLAFAIGIVASCAAAFGVGCSSPNSADNTPEHNYGEWVIDREATCIEVGRKYHTCQDEGCNETEWESIPKTAHKNDIINRTNEGHSFTCSFCNTTTEIEPHNFINGICTGCGADENEDYTFEFELSYDESFYTLKAVTDKNITEVIIPSTYKGKPVTNIGEYAFKNFTSLKNVLIPESVTTIGIGAFYGCTALEEISLPDGLTTIGHGAFYDCSSLEEFIMPDSVEYFIAQLISGSGPFDTNDGVFENCISLKHVTLSKNLVGIGYKFFRNCTSLESITLPDNCAVSGDVFDGCSNLTEIKVSENNEYYKTIDGNLYSKDGTTLVRYIGKQTEFEMPQSVTAIGSYAFSSCTILKQITLSDNVNSLSIDLENVSSKIVGGWTPSVDNSNGLVIIGQSAFYGCTGLTSITIPESVEYIGAWAFFGCTSLENVTFENTTGWRAGEVNINVLEADEVYFTEEELSDPAIAANYLTDKYFNYIWTNNKIFDNID